MQSVVSKVEFNDLNQSYTWSQQWDNKFSLNQLDLESISWKKNIYRAHVSINLTDVHIEFHHCTSIAFYWFVPQYIKYVCLILCITNFKHEKLQNRKSNWHLCTHMALKVFFLTIGLTCQHGLQSYLAHWSQTIYEVGFKWFFFIIFCFWCICYKFQHNLAK